MIEFIKNIISSYVLLPTTLILGVYMSYKLRWAQFSYLPESFKLLFFSKKASKRGFSALSAAMGVIGGNLGTGVISGMAVALSTGGVGSLLWMWVMAALGSILKSSSVYLGVLYRVKDNLMTHDTQKGNESFLGGPMVYIHKGLNSPLLAYLFIFLIIAGALTTGNMVQVNSIALPMIKAGIRPIYYGAIIFGLVSFSVFGGQNIFKIITTSFVPVMSVVYVGACIWILILHADKLPDVFRLIVRDAFNFRAVLSGTASFMLFKKIHVGFDRGLLATDAGIGLASILHSQVNTVEAEELTTEQHAAEQAKVALLAPFIVMIFCTLTGLVLMVTGVYTDPTIESSNMCLEAFKNGLPFKNAYYVIYFAVVLFGVTTIMTWSHCAEKAASLIGRKFVLIFKLVFVCLIPLGMFIRVQSAWYIADISLNLMLVINIFAMALLVKKIKL